MGDEIAGARLSLLRFQLEQRRFGDAALRILESLLVSRDVASLHAVRSSVKEFLRTEAFKILTQLPDEKTIEEKLQILHFFICAFSLTGDSESCLALKYEALLLRGQTCMNNQWLQVSYDEWLEFAGNSFENGFFSVAVKGYDNALKNIRSATIMEPKPDNFIVSTEVENIKKLRDSTMALVASHSVQAQTADYLTRKVSQHNLEPSFFPKDDRHPASSSFRSGIRKRNTRKLHQIQGLHLNH